MPKPLQPMRLEALLESRSDLTNEEVEKTPVVLTTRVRLARNLTGQPFPGWAKEAPRRSVLARCLAAVGGVPQMRRSYAASLDDLCELEKQMLFERHLISRDLMQQKGGAGIVVSRDQCCAVMINEEDHLRVQVLRAGCHLKKIWSTATALDSALEAHLDFAFNPEFGYLTACPSNVGTGLRASAMMHLPALVMAQQMDKVVHAVNQLGIVVRGLFGEGSDASGSIFQISNQTTLGESEEDIIARLTKVFNTIVEQEKNARARQLESEPAKLTDKIGRAYGVLLHSHLLNSTEAMNLLSLLRLGIDLGIFPEERRATIDRLFIECQPGHVQFACQVSVEAAQRDVLRARLLREQLAGFPPPDFKPLSPQE